MSLCRNEHQESIINTMSFENHHCIYVQHRICGLYTNNMTIRTDSRGRVQARGAHTHTQINKKTVSTNSAGRSRS